MPFVSSYNPRRSLTTTSGTASSTYKSGFDWLNSPITTTISNRPASTYTPQTFNLSRPSTVERIKNSDDSLSSCSSNASTSLLLPSRFFSRSEANSLLGKPKSRFDLGPCSHASSYSRIDDGGSQKETRPSRNHRFNTFGGAESIHRSCGEGTTPMNGGNLSHVSPVSGNSGSYSSRNSSSSSDLEKRIYETLVRHGLEESTRKNDLSYQCLAASDDDNNSLWSTWRRRIDETDLMRIEVVSKSTSPQPDASKNFRTRIARWTEPTIKEKRKYLNHRTYDVGTQTMPDLEFGSLAQYLENTKEKKEAEELQKRLNFDYFASVKKSLQNAPLECHKHQDVKAVFSNGDEEEYYEVKKVPLMLLLPGSREQKK